MAAYLNRFGLFPRADVCILIFQRCEHVRHVDREPAVHRGALQPPSPPPEDGGQGDEPSTSLTLLRYKQISAESVTSFKSLLKTHFYKTAFK